MEYLKFKRSKKDSLGGLVSAQSGPRPEQSSGHTFEQAGLSPPPTTRRPHLRDRLKWGSLSLSLSLSHVDENRSNTLDRPTTSQSQVDSANLFAQAHMLTAGGNVAAGDPGCPSSSIVQGSSFASPGVPNIHVSPEPISSAHVPSPTSGAQSPAKTDVHTKAHPDITDVAWAGALEIAKVQLGDSFPLELTNLTPQPAWDNIRAVIKALNALQEDEKKKRWSYTWRGKEIIIAERLGKILKTMESYSKVADTALPANSRVATLVWASVWAIMRVALNYVEMIEGFEVAIAVLIEKMYICEFYAGVCVGASLPSADLQSMIDSALPELYAAIIVFAVKARSYFEAGAMKKFASTLKSFNTEFQPSIDEINKKEEAISRFAGAATMERIKDIKCTLQDITLQLYVTEKIHNYIKDDRIFQLSTMLSPLEPRKRHQDVKSLRSENTGTWLLRLDSYCEWRSGADSVAEKGYVFCCYGIPGAGKTVICSIAVDDLLSQLDTHSDIGVACLYADYKDQSNQTLVHILGTFLCQFLLYAPPIPEEIVKRLDGIRYQRRNVETGDILAMLKIRLQQLKRAFICVDAVDELDSKVRQQLLNVLKELVIKNNIHLFLTGRGHIENEVQEYFKVKQGYTVTITASQEDIQEFVRQEIKEDLNPKAMDTELAKDIEDTIFEKSQGMFLLPSLHIKIILEMPTKSQRRKALNALPPDLLGAFRGIINRIRESPRKSHAEFGLRVLMWLHFAYRPLSLEELQHALAVETGHTEFDVDNILPAEVLLGCCLGLVAVDKEKSTVRFVHYTLEEYFRNYSTEEFPNGCSSIAETCLTYINFGDLRQRAMNDSWQWSMRKYVFLEYAALNWGRHVKQQCNEGLTELVQMVVGYESGQSSHALQILHLFQKYGDRIAEKFSGIHAMAYFGLTENIVYCCKVGRHVELKDGTGRTPLSWAAAYGHESIVQILIERDDVNIDSTDDYGRTPLWCAAENGHEAVVRLLIRRNGVNIDSKDDYGRTPLWCAAEGGHEAVVRLLIGRNDVDIDVKDNHGRTPFSMAAGEGHEAVVRLLIERDDVNIHVKDNGGRTPLMRASYGGHEAVVRLLIERNDVDIDVKDQDGQTPLMHAAWGGHEVVVRLLIERGDVNIDVKNMDGWTPFMHAAGFGHEAVVRLLLKRNDVDIDVRDKDGQTPLICAAQFGYEAVVRLLIERNDVDNNAKDKKGWTPLMYAAGREHEDVARLLIERDDVDIDVKDKDGQTALSLAVGSGGCHGGRAIVQLLKNRRDMRARGSDLVVASP